MINILLHINIYIFCEVVREGMQGDQSSDLNKINSSLYLVRAPIDNPLSGRSTNDI